MPNDDQSRPPTSAKIITIGPRPNHNRCPECKFELTFLYEAISKGEISFPKHCPNCGVEFKFGGKLHKGYECANPECREPVVDPEQTRFCTKCGKRLSFDHPIIQPTKGPT